MKEKLSILEAVGGEATDTAMERMILARELPKRTVALVLPTPVALRVVTVGEGVLGGGGGEPDVVNVWSVPTVVPAEFVAISR